MNSWVDIVRLIEAHVPQARGGTNNDEVLRSSLVSFANTTIDEIDREQRWSLSYGEPFFTTAQGTETYALPYPLPGGQVPQQTTETFIKRVYYVDATGRPVMLERLDQYEAQRVYGESQGLGASATAPPQGTPAKYYISPNVATAGGIDQGNPQMQIFLYPTPDASGPEANGNYKIRIQGYWATPPIIETVANTTGTTLLTFSTAGAGAYLGAVGVPSNSTNWNLFLAIRNGGNPTGLTQYPNDTHVCNWSNIATNSATLSLATSTTTNNLPTYFNACNWIITHWGKMLLYGVIREIGNYYNKTEMFQVWDQKFQMQLEKLRAYEWDRQRGVELLAAAVLGQRGSALRVNDLQSFLDIRGGGGW